MKIELIRVEKPQDKVVVDKLPAILGRDPAADVHLEDSWVGQMQCILDVEGGVLHVMDLGTRLGTFVNGHRVQQATLLPGDQFTVGRTTFLVQYEPASHPEPPPAESTSTSASRT